jgi:hypothetical protein
MKKDSLESKFLYPIEAQFCSIFLTSKLKIYKYYIFDIDHFDDLRFIRKDQSPTLLIQLQ